MSTRDRHVTLSPAYLSLVNHTSHTSVMEAQRWSRCPSLKQLFLFLVVVPSLFVALVATWRMHMDYSQHWKTENPSNGKSALDRTRVRV